MGSMGSVQSGWAFSPEQGINPMAQRQTKYTQDFVFEGEGFASDYVRAVVERSCEAVFMLMQDMFAAADKAALGRLAACQEPEARERAALVWSETIRSRPVLENAVLNAVLCGYADMVNGAAARKANMPVVEKMLRSMEDARCDRLDLEILLSVGDALGNAIDCDRPLLVRLSAQLGVLFGWGESQIGCNPLSPVTLTAGFLAGLTCCDISPVTKRQLLRAFNQYFLSRLTVLISGMINRLEEEQLPIRHGADFEEDNAGPIARVLDHPARIGMDELYAEVDAVYENMAKHVAHPVGSRLHARAADVSLDSLVDLLDEVRYQLTALAPVIARSRSSENEYHMLHQARTRARDVLEAAMANRILAPEFVDFFRQVWPDVLFHGLVTAGEESAGWKNLLELQEQTLASITPVSDDSLRRELAKQAPMVVKSLRQVLEQSGFAFVEIAHWLDRLKSLQLQNALNKLSATTGVVWQPLPLPPPVSIDVIASADDLAVYEQVLHTAASAAYA